MSRSIAGLAFFEHPRDVRLRHKNATSTLRQCTSPPSGSSAPWFAPGCAERVSPSFPSNCFCVSCLSSHLSLSCNLYPIRTNQCARSESALRANRVEIAKMTGGEDPRGRPGERAVAGTHAVPVSPRSPACLQESSRVVSIAHEWDTSWLEMVRLVPQESPCTAVVLTHLATLAVHLLNTATAPRSPTGGRIVMWIRVAL